jgi:PhnB protein
MATRAKAGKAKRKAPKRKASAVPRGFNTVSVHIVQQDCGKAIEFYKKAFGAKAGLSMPGPGGKIVHAEVVIGSSTVMMSDEMDPMPGQPGVYKSPKSAGLNTAALFLYVPNVDKWFSRAVEAGCTVRSPLMDMFWGDRFAQVIDPFGHTWGMATHTEDVSPGEMKRRHQAFVASMSAGQK